MDKQYSFAEIEMEVNNLAAKIGASGNALPTYGRTKDGAHPHIEVDAHGYHYVVVERGNENMRVTTSDLDVLLYTIFKYITHELASKYSANHRSIDQDFRRMLFQKQIELLSVLSPDWADTESRNHEQILLRYPYDDFSTRRATLAKDLRDKGHSAEDAERMACEKYPLLKLES